MRVSVLMILLHLCVKMSSVDRLPNFVALLGPISGFQGLTIFIMRKRFILTLFVFLQVLSLPSLFTISHPIVLVHTTKLHVRPSANQKISLFSGASLSTLVSTQDKHL